MIFNDLLERNKGIFADYLHQMFDEAFKNNKLLSKRIFNERK